MAYSVPAGLPSPAVSATSSVCCVAFVTDGASGWAASVHLLAVAGAVDTESPFRDRPLNVYCVLGLSPPDAHGAAVCTQPEFVPAVVFA